MKYKYECITTIKAGEVAEFVGHEKAKTSSFTKGKLYVAREDYVPTGFVGSPWAKEGRPIGSFRTIIDDEGSTSNGWGAGLFRKVKTRPGHTAKEGDLVMCVIDTPGDCHDGDSFIVRKVEGEILRINEGVHLRHKLSSGSWGWNSKYFVVIEEGYSLPLKV